jgi:beta-glucanase (GH16 family)
MRATLRRRPLSWAAALLAGACLAFALATPSGATPAARWHKPTPTPTSPTPTVTSSTASPTPSPTPTPTPTSTTTTAAPTDPTACGGEVVSKPDGSAWVCTFDDEFSGTTLDTSKWVVQTTAASGFHSGVECFVNSPNNVSVSGGMLRLTARQESAQFVCADPQGNYTTQYTSGTVNGLGKFSQTYGRFEVRAQLPAATVRGLQETLWLWPVNQFKYGLWPLSGEIDFAEVYSDYAGWNIPYLHYGVDQSTVNWTTNTNVYTALPAPYNQPGMNCRIAVGQFNTYTVVWQPGQIVLQVNNQNCIVDNYSATNVAPPAPFDQPFFIALTQALGIGNNAFVPGYTPLPATTTVDYVRVWK